MTDLKKLAEMASPGPWQQYEDVPDTVAAATQQFEVKCPFSLHGKYLTARLTVNGGFHRVEDAAYIAAAHPQKILELLQEVETLRGQVTHTRQEALEEAAKVCDELEAQRKPYSYEPNPYDCAKAIRALQHTGEVPDNG